MDHATPKRREPWRRPLFEADAEGMLPTYASGDLCKVLVEAQSDMGEGLLVLEDRRIRYANEAFCLITGRSAAELRALATLSELVVPEQRPVVEDLTRRHLFDEAVEDRHETTILRKSGERVDLEVVFRSLRGENRPLQLVVLARDITERKRTEEKLQSSLGALMAVHETGRILNSTLEQGEIAARLLQAMSRLFDLSAAVISLRDEHGRLRELHADGPESLWRVASNTPEAQAARRRALETKERQPFRPRQQEGNVTSLTGLCLPLVVRDLATGVLEAYGCEALEKKTTVEILESVSRQAANALENARLHRELAEREHRLQDLVDKLLVAREEERRRVACDIHDGLTQVAVAAHQNLQAFANDHPPGSPSSETKLSRALELVKQMVEEVRGVIANLRPVVLDDLGLAAALRLRIDSLRAEGWEIGYDETLGEERLAAEIETTLYGVCQEALTNVRKHARTTRANVTLKHLGDRIYLEVQDRGCGFDGAVSSQNAGPGEQVGLRGIRERIALLGGEHRIHSCPGVGTSVVAEIPLLRTAPVREEQPQLKTSPVRLLIADDHPLVREGLQAMLTGELDLEVVGEATDGREAVELCHRLRPDLVLMDVRMPKVDGLAAARAIKAGCSATGILMLTTYENPDYLFEAVRAGAAGYVTKDATKNELVSAVRGALGGENPLNPELAMQLLRRLAYEDELTTGTSRGLERQPEPLPEALTPREVEILRLVAQGRTNRQISHELIISPATVKVHVEHILAKLGVSDRTQAAVRASEAGLLGPKSGYTGQPPLLPEDTPAGISENNLK
jgi:PAS domain S-box-containing protein